MKRRKLLPIILIFSLLTIAIGFPAAFAQYCTPPAFITGPHTGITNVKLVNLDNPSSYNVGVMYYSSVPAPTLTKGSQYTITLITVDYALLGQNTRVWIDYNQDKDFEDINEEVAIWDEHVADTITYTFTVPTKSVAGVVRMRVYTDMPVKGGHIPPEPCGYLNYPTHPIGHHGEVEDYDLIIVGPTAINEMSEPTEELHVYSSPDGNVQIRYDLFERYEVTLEIYNIIGEKLSTLANNTQIPGHYLFNLSEKDSYYSSNNVYFVKLSINGSIFTRKFITF